MSPASRGRPAAAWVVALVLSLTACGAPGSGGSGAAPRAEPGASPGRGAGHVGEGPELERATSDGPQVPWNRLVSAGGSWVLGWRPVPAPIPLQEAFDLELELAPAAGGPLPDGLQLKVDAAMPQHQHGMLQRCGLRRTAPGRYLADGLLFHMPGEWTLMFDVTVGALTERAEQVVHIE